MTDQELIEQLQHLTDGLWWMSEADYPFELIYWVDPTLAPLTPPCLKQKVGCPEQTPVAEETLTEFFGDALVPQAWQSPQQQAAVKRYQALVKFLATHLRGLRVFRLGTIEIEVYILGQTAANSWLGLKTVEVKT